MLCLFYLQKRRENIGKDVGAYLKYAEKSAKILTIYRQVTKWIIHKSGPTIT